MPDTINDYWFSWNGTKSYEVYDSSGNQKLIVKSPPRFTSPKKKYTQYVVDGRNGDIIVPQDAYENFTISIDVFLYTTGRSIAYEDLSNFCHTVANWLYAPDGYAKLELYGRSGYYLAYYVGSTDVENDLFKFGSARLDFECRPENYITSTPTVYSSGDITTTTNSYGETVQRIIVNVPEGVYKTSEPIISFDVQALLLRETGDYRLKIYVHGNPDTRAYVLLTESFRQSVRNSLTHLVVDSASMQWYVTTELQGHSEHDDDLGFSTLLSRNVGAYVSYFLQGSGLFPVFDGTGAYNTIDVLIEKKSGNTWSQDTTATVGQVKVLPRWWKL